MNLAVKAWNLLNAKYTAGLLFLLLIFTGLFTFNDYGIGWDEPSQMEIAAHNYNYVFNNDSSFANYQYRYYGMGFDLPLYALQKNIDSLKNQYLVKHLLVHLFFLLAIFCFYQLNYNIFKHKALALLACIILVLSPRIYADSFHNSKDLVFLSAFILAFYTFIKYFKNRSIKNLIIHAIASGFLVNIRVMGLLIIALTLLNFCIEFYLKNFKAKPFVQQISLFLIIAFGTLYLTWPNLWDQPITHFWGAINEMKHYNWDDKLLYRGHIISSSNLPWHYLITWIGITTPELYLGLYLLGCILLFVFGSLHFKIIIKNHNQRIIYYAFIFSVLPVFLIIALHSNVYDAWRHLFFIYPFMVIVAVFGFKEIVSFFKQRKDKGAVGIIFISFFMSFFMVGFQMIYYHPHQNTYFNNLVSHNKNYIRHHYEMDYWGLSYKQALQYLALTEFMDSAKNINIVVDTNPGAFNLEMLDESVKSRFKLCSKLEDADYFITTYRRKNTDYAEFYKEIYTITVHNSSILSVFKIRD